MGAANASAIVTMVERVTRYTLLGHLPGTRHDSATVRDAGVAALAVLPPHLRRTLTWDQGTEIARHAEIGGPGTTGIYFCKPHSPWQRPSNAEPYFVLPPRSPASNFERSNQPWS
jgi:IS30 family transposase